MQLLWVRGYMLDRDCDLGVESGKAITSVDLCNYGKTSVIFTKLNDELFYMDFSNGLETND